jgi:hypothetical protein
MYGVPGFYIIQLLIIKVPFMKKKFLSFIFILGIISIHQLFAQTGIAINSDGSAADGSAMLDVKASDKGILIPRVALTTSVTSPVNGLLVYQTGSTPGFYYYNGSAWIYIQNSGNTALNASNLTSGTVPLARLGASGTTNSTTFLRGDNTWATPASSGTGQTFAINAAMPGNTSQNWIGLNSGALATFGANHRAIVMPVAGTFDAIYLSCTISSAAASSNITVTLYKNGTATAMQAVVTVTALNVTVTASDLAHPISVVAGDLISIGIIQSNSVPVIQFGVSTRFQ